MKMKLIAASLGLTAVALSGCQSADHTDVSTDAILKNPSPELRTLTERPVDVSRNYHITADQNKRMFWEDLGRFWYTDRPSRLTPANVTSTSGKLR